jgi:hypothetical protein
MSTLDEGAVLNAGHQKAKVIITDSVFTNNSAVEGAVFAIDSESEIKVYNSSIFNNFAISSGVAKVTKSGYFEFYDSKIYQNYAKNNPISIILDCATISLFNNCEIYGNRMISGREIVDEVNSCDKLCFINDSSAPNYKSIFHYILNNTEPLIKDLSVPHLLQVIYGSLKFINFTKIRDQSMIVNSFVSTVIFEDSHITNILSENCILSARSILNITNVAFENITTQSNSDDFIKVSFGSLFVIENIMYKSSSSPLFHITSSNMTAENITFIDIANMRYLFEIFDSISTNITNVRTSSTLSISTSLINIRNSNEINLCNFLIEDISQIVISIERSNVDLMKNISISSSLKALTIKDSNVSIVNSQFFNNGEYKSLKGGAVEIYQSNVRVNGTNFTNNVADTGAAIYFY